MSAAQRKEPRATLITPDVIALRDGPLHRFAAGVDSSIPNFAAGVYTVWDADDLIYVGMAGRSITGEEAPSARRSGLASRLASHASGRRSGDQFCVYVCDRLLLQALTREQIREIAAGTVKLDRLVRDYIHARMSYRYILVPDGKTAYAIEREVQGGALGNQPLFNPLPMKK